jgi:hypothetical protein
MTQCHLAFYVVASLVAHRPYVPVMLLTTKLANLRKGSG